MTFLNFVLLVGIALAASAVTNFGQKVNLSFQAALAQILALLFWRHWSSTGST